jgi:hypothetical protein
MAFSREMSLRYQSIAAWELYTMFLRLMGPTFEKIIILLCNNSFCFRQENQSNSVWSIYNFQEIFTEKVAIMISAAMQAPFLTTSWEVSGTLEHIVNFSYF